MTDRTDPYEIIGVRRDASLAEIRISYRRSTQILAPERFANANDTVRAEAARRLSALNGAMEAIEAERAAESGSALGSLTFGGPAVSPAVEPSLRSIAVADEPRRSRRRRGARAQDGVDRRAREAAGEPHDEPRLVEELPGEEPPPSRGAVTDDTQDEAPQPETEGAGPPSTPTTRRTTCPRRRGHRRGAGRRGTAGEPADRC